MKKIYTLTIGIPAFNEEKNIKNLLEKILEQQNPTHILKSILVISDGSSDETVKRARQVKDKRIQVIDGKIRLGKAARLNQIFRKSNSDILITMDADVVPGDVNFHKKIITTFYEKPTTDLVSVKVVPTNKQQSLVGKIIAHSQLMKNEMNSDLLSLKPLHLCVGRAFGYSKKLYKKLLFPTNILAEDAFACLFCLKNNCRIVHQKEAVVYYAPPSTLADHLKQSTRFLNSKDQLVNYFTSEYVSQSYSIPTCILIKNAIKGLMHNPVLTIFYVIILVYTKMRLVFQKNKMSHLWEIAQSSKEKEIKA